MSYDRTQLRLELVRDEGLRLTCYRCTAGKLSIGVGRNLDDVGIRAGETGALGITRASVIAHGLTRDQAMALLDDDIDECERELDAHLPWWRQLDGVRQRVLLNMCFNMGIVTLMTFRQTLGCIANGRYGDAARGMAASKWHRQVGARAERLEQMMKTGAVA